MCVKAFALLGLCRSESNCVCSSSSSLLGLGPVTQWSRGATLGVDRQCPSRRWKPGVAGTPQPQRGAYRNLTSVHYFLKLRCGESALQCFGSHSHPSYCFHCKVLVVSIYLEDRGFFLIPKHNIIIFYINNYLSGSLETSFTPGGNPWANLLVVLAGWLPPRRWKLRTGTALEGIGPENTIGFKKKNPACHFGKQFSYPDFMALNWYTLGELGLTV